MGKKTWGQPNFFSNVIRLNYHYQPLLNVIIALATFISFRSILLKYLCKCFWTQTCILTSLVIFMCFPPR